jgi:hypothetical protein
MEKLNKNKIMNKNYITHLYLLVDASGSMQKHRNSVRQVLDSQIEHWSERARTLKQTVRLSVYFFNKRVECVVYDADISTVLGLSNLYNPTGETAFIDANIEAIKNGLEIPEKYGDHSHLLICLTDGENNVNNHKRNILRETISKLPENWTVSALVPNSNGVHECKYFGYPANNIQIWDCSSNEGFDEMAQTMYTATDTYLMARSSGLRSTSNLFNLDASKISKTEVKKKLDVLQPFEYELLTVNKESYIKDFIESWKLPFRKGANYYQISKPETIQSFKNIIIQDKINGKLYTGVQARKMLNLPNFNIKVKPSDCGQYNLFIQSSSSNRRLVKGTQLIILK